MLFNFFFSRVFLSCVCVSWGVFVPLNEIVLYCIAFYSICNKCVTRRLVIENRKLQKINTLQKGIGGAPTNYRRRRADQQKSAAGPTKFPRGGGPRPGQNQPQNS